MHKIFSRIPDSRFLLIAVLGFYSGLPLALTASTLSAWLADAKIERAAIGLFAAVGTPYAIKFLWAPLVDGLRIPVLQRLGRRRSWLLLVQLLLALCIAAMGLFDPANAVNMTALVAVVVATLSATQDIVIDAYRVERMSEEEQGLGSAYATFGYRMGMLVSGAGALALADAVGWRATYFIMGAVMGLSLVVTLLAKKEESGIRECENTGSTRFSFSRIRFFFSHSVMAPFADFMTRPHWLAVILFVIIYKIGDALLGVMFNPFLLEIGFTKTQIATIVKFYGLIATLSGAFVGGWMVQRSGLFRTLFICGVLHMLTNLLLVMQARVGADTQFLAFSISLENFTGGMSTTAFIAYLSALCKRHYTATQYALLSALSAVGRTWLSTPSGWLVSRFGWEVFFVICCVVTLPGLALLWWLERRRD